MRFCASKTCRTVLLSCVSHVWKSMVSFLQSSDSHSWRRTLLLLCIEGKPTGASGLFRSIPLHILRASPLSVFTCLGVSPACSGAPASCKAARGISFRVLNTSRCVFFFLCASGFFLGLCRCLPRLALTACCHARLRICRWSTFESDFRKHNRVYMVGHRAYRTKRLL